VLALAFGEETVVTDAMETGREHVDEKAADELAGSERHHLDACGSVDAVVFHLKETPSSMATRRLSEIATRWV
jgi:hypothetical protein